MTTADTMAAEKTLTKIEQEACPFLNEQEPGCCQCEEECGSRECAFGDAIGCKKSMACSAWCPRLMSFAVAEDRNGESSSAKPTADKSVKRRTGVQIEQFPDYII